MSQVAHTSAPGRSSFEERLRALRNERRNVALPGLALTYLAVAALLAAPAITGWWWLPLAMLVPMGLLQYRIVLSGHEAVHKTLCWPEWLNEALGVFGQAIVGVNFASYRVQHLEHHRAGRPEDDPDGHIYGPIIRARAGWRRWGMWFFGTFLEIAVKIVQKGIGSIGTGKVERTTEASRAASRRHTLYVVLAQLSLVGICWASTGRITGYLELWLIPLFGVAVLVNRSRILVEHGLAILTDEAPPDRRLPTIDVVAPVWQRELFAPYGFSYHASHHLHMTVPWYNLPKLQALLREQGTSGWRAVDASYPEAIRRTMRL